MDSRRGCGSLSLFLILTIITTIDARILTAQYPETRLSFPLAACLPAFRDALPPPYRRICAALDSTKQQDLANLFAVQAADTLENDAPELMAAGTRTEVPASPPLLMDNSAGVKRQDMEHVFFRFGRRQK